MRLKFFGLAASSLVLLACGDESSSTASPKVTPLSNDAVLAQIAGEASSLDMVKGLAASAAGQVPGGATAAGRTLDECTDAVNQTVQTKDSTTGETMTMTMKVSLGDGTAITCNNLQGVTSLRFSITMSAPSMNLAMAMTTNLRDDGSMSLVGTGSASFSDSGHVGGFSDLNFTSVADATGELQTFSGSMKLVLDGASTDAIAFDANGPTADQTVKIYRNGGVIGSMTFVADGSVVVKDATGKVVSTDSAA